MIAIVTISAMWASSLATSAASAPWTETPTNARAAHHSAARRVDLGADSHQSSVLQATEMSPDCPVSDPKLSSHFTVRRPPIPHDHVDDRKIQVAELDNRIGEVERLRLDRNPRELVKELDCVEGEHYFCLPDATDLRQCRGQEFDQRRPVGAQHMRYQVNRTEHRPDRDDLVQSRELLHCRRDWPASHSIASQTSQ